jgi:hypothetical protein
VSEIKMRKVDGDLSVQVMTSRGNFRMITFRVQMIEISVKGGWSDGGPTSIAQWTVEHHVGGAVGIIGMKWMTMMVGGPMVVSISG